MKKLLLIFIALLYTTAIFSCSDDSGTNSNTPQNIVISGDGSQTVFNAIKFMPFSFSPAANLLFFVGAEEPDSLMMFILYEQIELNKAIPLNDERIGIITLFGNGGKGAFNDTTLYINGSITFTKIDTTGIIAAEFSQDASLFGTNAEQTKSFQVAVVGSFKASKDLTIFGKKLILSKKTQQKLQSYKFKNNIK